MFLKLIADVTCSGTTVVVYGWALCYVMQNFLSITSGIVKSCKIFTLTVQSYCLCYVPSVKQRAYLNSEERVLVVISNVSSKWVHWNF